MRQFNNMIFALITLCTTQLTAEADWTFLVYMESSEHMTNWGVSNINAMAQAGSTKHINILAQWHAHQNQAWRYFIGKNTIHQVEPVPIGTSYVNDLVNSMQWAVTNYPAKHYCLVLWDHGFGVLEPFFVSENSNSFTWDVEADGPTPLCQSGFCPIKSPPGLPPSSLFAQNTFRAILFNGVNKSFLTNEQLKNAMQRIKYEVLNGKNLDILGTDACKMAMLEVGYQVEQSVDYLTGCQNCSLADGWNYQGLFERIGSAYHTPKSVAQNIIAAYADYYNQHDSDQIFTHSAINLRFIQELTSELNSLVMALSAEADSNNAVKNAAYAAKSRCTPICDAPYYIDLYSFLREFEFECTQQNLRGPVLLAQIQDTCQKARNLISLMVVANTTGKNFVDVHGLSIYFPNQHIDSSYARTLFAQESLWPLFLKNILKCN